MVWTQRRRAVLVALVAVLASAVGLGMAATAGPSRNPTERPEDFRIALNFGCLDDDACLAGLRSVYGFDLASRMAILPDGMSLPAALTSGEADVAALASVAVAAENELTVLHDDLQLFAADVAVPIGARESLLRGGIWLHRAVDAVSAALDDPTFRRIVAETQSGGDQAKISAAWAKKAGLPKAPRRPSAERRIALEAPVSIGGLNTPEGTALAAVYRAGLGVQGFRAKAVVLPNDVDRLLRSVNDATVTMAVAHVTPLLLSITDRTRTVVGDQEGALSLLRAQLNRRGIAVYEPSQVLAGPVLAATPSVAEDLRLRSWSDLARFAEPALAAPEVVAPALVRATDVDLYVGARGPAVQRMQKRLVQVGHDPGRVDGVFEEHTRRAVLSFQQSQILPTTGTVGQLTRRRLDIPYGPEGERAARAEAAEAAAVAAAATP